MNADKGIIEDVNPYLMKFLNYPEAHFIGKELWEIGVFEDAKTSQAAFRQLQEKGFIRYDDLPLRSKDGNALDVEFISNVYMVANKKVIQCNIRDITERKKTVKINEQNKIFLSQLIDDQPVAFFVTAVKDLRIVFMSENVKNLTGYSAANFIENSKLWSDNINPTDKVWLLPLLNEKIVAGKGTFEYKYKCADGTDKCFLSSFIVKKENDEDYIYGTWVDISERKRTADIIQVQYQKLLKTNSELDKFVYSTSHDLRAPLTSIQGLITIVEENLSPNEDDQRELLNMMKISVTKLDDFIGDILYYSYNARSTVDQNEIDFEAIIAESRDNLKYQSATPVIFKVEVNQKGAFYSDKKRLFIVLNNLISNAIKYSDFSKEKSFVTITVESDTREAQLTIEDNGIGIADKDHSKIFEMFYRGTNLSTGSGLGMYILKETLDKIQGTVQLESELKKGSTFTITLPNLQKV